ncbi:NAD(P)/FAD-dependent oxidoreductase [Pseudomonas sp. FME51]|uniref:flavin-dependent monooxygenase QhpG n=1 Tax=Pseudomonas sp. FME51 TaxID=2742609 RepID=UPI001869210D|nr:FAD-dependent oxidoreductase [Pseudomonas sp. FME51]
MRKQRIAVLGAGPAGAAAALGLLRMGYDVRVISDWRRFNAVEGISERVLQALYGAGLQRASAVAMPAATREVYWAGARQLRNRELLLNRQHFDRALREDLRQAGIMLIEARVLAIDERKTDTSLQLDGADDLDVDFIVDARGRQAPRSGDAARGPETLSLLCRWEGAPGEAASAVESMESGWCWLARLADGQQYWQWTFDARQADMPGKTELAAWCAAQRVGTHLAGSFYPIEPGVAVELKARSSTCTLASDLCTLRSIRIGDAAMAADPLSGNGIFQSLSSALQAPAVVNTLLCHPADATLAQSFHRRRVTELFYRFARLGRDFYRQVEAEPHQRFWLDRQHWPDQQDTHAAVTRERVTTDWAPVIAGSRISKARVVITPDQPLGIWHLNGVELAPLVDALRDQPWQQVIAQVAVPQRDMVAGWLCSIGYGPGTEVPGQRIRSE